MQELINLYITIFYFPFSLILISSESTFLGNLNIASSVFLIKRKFICTQTIIQMFYITVDQLFRYFTDLPVQKRFVSSVKRLFTVLNCLISLRSSLM